MVKGLTKSLLGLSAIEQLNLSLASLLAACPRTECKILKLFTGLGKLEGDYTYPTRLGSQTICSINSIVLGVGLEVPGTRS